MESLKDTGDIFLCTAMVAGEEKTFKVGEKYGGQCCRLHTQHYNEAVWGACPDRHVAVIVPELLEQWQP